MSIRPQKSLFQVAYRLQRSDHVAMATALVRQPPACLIFEITAYFMVVALLGLALAGSTDAWFTAFVGALSLPAALVTIPVLTIGPVILALLPQIAGALAALLYRRHATAGQDVTLDVTSYGIEGGGADNSGRADWSTMTALIETPSHLFVRVAAHRALIIPRRALPHEDDYLNLRGFIRARTGLATR